MHKRCSHSWRNDLLLTVIIFSLADPSFTRNSRCCLTHCSFNQLDQSSFSGLVEAVEIISPECGRINKVRPNNGVHLRICKLNLCVRL